MPMDAPTPPEILERAKRDNRSLEAPWDLPREDGTVDEIWGKPAGLWEGKAYQRLGAMMWPDYCAFLFRISSFICRRPRSKF